MALGSQQLYRNALSTDGQTCNQLGRGTECSLSAQAEALGLAGEAWALVP